MAERFNWRGALGGALYAGASPGVQRMMEISEQQKKEDKAAKALYDALTPEEDVFTGEVPKHPLGMKKDAFNALSARDRVAAMGGLLKANALKSALEDQAMQQAEFQRAALADTELMAAIRTAGQPSATEAMDIGPGAMPLNEGRLLEAIRQHPNAVLSPRFGNVMEAMRATGGQEAPLGFGPEDVIDLGKIDPRLEGQFQVRQSRGSFQNLNTQPRAMGGLPFAERVQLMDRADLQKRRLAITKQLGEFLPPEQVPLLTAELQAINERLSTGGNGGSGEGKALDRATAATLLKEAGGDKAKARDLAKQRGYTF